MTKEKSNFGFMFYVDFQEIRIMSLHKVHNKVKCSRYRPRVGPEGG